MASFSHNLYSDHLFYPNNFCDVGSQLMGPGDTGLCGIRNNYHNHLDHLAIGQETCIPSFDRTELPEQSFDALSSLLAMPCPDFGGPVSDMTVPSLPEFNMGLYGIHSLIGSQPTVPGPCDYDEEFFGSVPDLKPLYRYNWGSESNYEIMHEAKETNNIKVASRYSEQERKERIVRYLKKRNQRNFNKTIKYACRKNLADRRTRVRGRFARNSIELCDTQIPLKADQLTTATNHNLINQTDKEEEEENWLQELAASLMYLPYVTN